MGDETDVKIHW